MKTQNRLVLAGMLAGTMVFALVAQASQTGKNGALPIRKVILYKHGVGYFERQGTVTGGENVEIHFKKEQMNDLLKSLTVIDLSGSPITGIVYDSTKTFEQLLGDYTFDLRGPVGLPQILGQLQGCQIELTVGSEQIQGMVGGIEQRISREGELEIPAFYLSIFDTTGQLRSFRTDEIVSVRFLDQRLEEDIQRYMQILFQQHRRDEKILSISTSGNQQKELVVSYVTEMPVWKATYRILLPDSQEKDAKPFLQGWAIVDNISEEDWSNVQLSLVSGLPISFVQNLYDPIFKMRPHVEVEEEMALAPSVPEAGRMAGEPAQKPARAKLARAMKSLEMADMAPPAPAETPAIESYAGRGGGGSIDGYSSEINLEERMRDLEAETVTREVGDLFEYKIDHPVTVERNRSALLPIVARDLEGQGVDLYNEATRTKNPLAAVRLKNTTGLTLEGGPLTVMQGDSYVGEAMIQTVKPDEQRYITYAVDLGMHVNTKLGSKSERVDRVIINRGTMQMHRAIIETKVYNLDNKNDKNKTVVIEHPAHADWKLLSKVEPIEKTDNFLRFEVSAAAGELTEFEVQEMRDNWESLAVTNVTPDLIEVFVRDKYISDQTRQQLDQIIVVKAEIAHLEQSIQQLQQEREGLFADQQRLRENLKSLGNTEDEKKLRGKYIEQLTKQESRLEEITKGPGSIPELQKQSQEKQQNLNQMIENLAQDLQIK